MTGLLLALALAPAQPATYPNGQILITADTLKNLLANSLHPGTVVRWSAARALGEILKLRTKHNRSLIPAVEAVVKRGNEDRAIMKIYQSALKRVNA